MLRRLCFLTLILSLMQFGCVPSENDSTGQAAGTSTPMATGGVVSGPLPAGAPIASAGTSQTGGTVTVAGTQNPDAPVSSSGGVAAIGGADVGGTFANGGEVGSSTVGGMSTAGGVSTAGGMSAVGGMSGTGGAAAPSGGMPDGAMCTREDCGPMPLRDLCQGGTVTCQRNENGVCGWVFYEPDADGDMNCDPTDDACNLDDEVLFCRRLPPPCPEGKVPVIVNGCYEGDTCVDWAECAARVNGGNGEPVEMARCGSRGLPPCPAGQFCQFPSDSLCGGNDRGGVCQTPPDVCPEIYQPVCGCDGMTYENDCKAAGASQSVRAAGACECGNDEVRDDMGLCVKGCTGDQDCNPGEACNAGDVCRRPPGCGPGDVCANVCYGWCR